MPCHVCGAECGTYALCFKCNKLKSEGKISKCDRCGKYYYTDKGCECKKATAPVSKPLQHENAKKADAATSNIPPHETSKKVSPHTPNGKCIICGNNAPKGFLCYDCYKKKEAEKAELGRGRTKQEAMDHYFNQRNCLYRIKTPAYIENGAIRLFAIADEAQSYGDTYLGGRVVDDVITLIDWKNKKTQKPTAQESAKTAKREKHDEAKEPEEAPPISHSFDDIDYRKQWVAEHQCDDGHYVRSYSEMLIDNWLYNNGYRHAYEKSVFMQSDPDAVVLSDFYIPDGNVYIEFWGLNDDQRYMERKKKKQEMYKANHLNLINLEETDVKRLNDILPRALFEFVKK